MSWANPTGRIFSISSRYDSDSSLSAAAAHSSMRLRGMCKLMQIPITLVCGAAFGNQSRDWQHRADSLAIQDELQTQQFTISKLAAAKILLRQQTNLSDGQAHRFIQKRAMDNRCSFDMIALEIISERSPEGLLKAFEEYTKLWTR